MSNPEKNSGSQQPSGNTKNNQENPENQNENETTREEASRAEDQPTQQENNEESQQRGSQEKEDEIPEGESPGEKQQRKKEENPQPEQGSRRESVESVRPEEPKKLARDIENKERATTEPHYIKGTQFLEDEDGPSREDVKDVGSGGDEPPPSRRQSELYVLHGKGSVSRSRRCHLPRTEGVNVKARRLLLIASILCLFFIAIEVIGGVLSGSLAVAADAAHTLTDFAGFMISLFAIWLAGRRATDRLSFGWHRAEIIGALVSVLSIWAVTAILVYMAIERCVKGDFEIDAVIMMITSVFAIVTNVILSIILIKGTMDVEVVCDPEKEAFESKKAPPSHGHGHRQSHGASHGHSHSIPGINKIINLFKKCKIRKQKSKEHLGSPSVPNMSRCHPNQGNINVNAALLHVIGDGLQSVGVLLAGLIIYLQPTWIIADPICTFIFAVIVLYTTVYILKDIIMVLMEGTPNFVDYTEIKRTFEEIEGVKSVHSLRVWALSLDKVALAVHLVIEKGWDANAILQQAEDAIHTHYSLYETTIQIEEEGSD